VSKNSRPLSDYLDDMLNAIARIERNIGALDKQSFLTSESAQDLTTWNLSIIGEASHNISKLYPEFAASHNEINFKVAYQIRNVLIHGYFTIDYDIVWQTVREDLPLFREQLQQITQELEQSEGPSNDLLL
jgi:uncharacterized protein with HEPN domain